MAPLLTLVKHPFFQIALQVGGSQVQKYVGSKIDQKVILQAQEKVELEINTFLLNIWERTLLYSLLILLNIAGLLLIYFFDNPYFSMTAALLVLVMLVTSSLHMVNGFIRAVNYIENFETHLKILIEQEFKKAKSENWKNQLYIFINSKGSEDYYNLILEESVRVLSIWLKNNKRIFYIRILYFIAASFLLSISTREALNSFSYLF